MYILVVFFYSCVFFLCGSVFPPHKQEVEVMETESLGKLLPGPTFCRCVFSRNFSNNVTYAKQKNCKIKIVPVAISWFGVTMYV